MWAIVDNNIIIEVIKNPIPKKIGNTIYTNWVSWTEEERNDIGIYTIIENPIPELAYNEKWIDDSYEFINNKIYKNKNKITLTQQELENKEYQDKLNWKNIIDEMAGEIRNSIVAKGQLIAEEYFHSYQQATDYINSGYIGDPPPTVTAWMNSNDVYITAIDAANDIKATGDLYYNILEQIRTFRLKGKYDVENASQENIEIQGQLAINNLQSIIQ